MQFISMGVQAFIAPGWDVDDAGAITFARTFYSSILDGRDFAEAVQLARRRTYEQHPHASTWGVYHCYGEPEFRLLWPS